MYTLLCTFLITSLLLFCSNTSAQERCLTPTNVNGNCINIMNCNPLLNLLKKKPLTQENLEFLRASQCGFDGNSPKVCCANQGPISSEIIEVPDVSNHPNLRLLELNICGPLLGKRIIGGNKTGVLDYPWMALLAYNTGRRNPEYRCGGSLINKRYVLTAAHCVTSLPSGLTLIGVRIGEHTINTERDCDRDANGIEIVCTDRYQDLGIESVHYHQDYSPKSLQNDIALIRLNDNADYTAKNIKPICLPIQNIVPLGINMTVTGWGTTENGTRSLELLAVNLPPVSNEQCQDIFKNKIQIWQKQLCVGGLRNMDSCLGDSGGPLQTRAFFKNNIRYFQYGIVSFGMKSCGISGFPGVYTNVKYYMDWILNTIRD